MDAFSLDPRLQADTLEATVLGLCELRLMNDARWPWAILVPRRPGLTEWHEMTPLDQTLLAFEAGLVARAMKEIAAADKINVGALGNVVSQLHVHVVARHKSDAAWPGPVWGHGEREPYAPEAGQAYAERLRDAVLPLLS